MGLGAGRDLLHYRLTEKLGEGGIAVEPGAAPEILPFPARATL